MSWIVLTEQLNEFENPYKIVEGGDGAAEACVVGQAAGRRQAAGHRAGDLGDLEHK